MKKLAFVLLFAASVSPAFALTEIVNGIEWTYTVSGGEATIGGSWSAAIPTDTTGSVTVPTSLGGAPVKTLGSYAFGNCSQITSVTLPSGLKKIGSSVFYGCSALSSCSIPSGVTNIGSSAFYNCSKLESMSIPDGVTTLSYGTFTGCSKLETLTVGAGITSTSYLPKDVKAFRVSESSMTFSVVDGVLLNKDGTKMLLFPSKKSGSYTIPNSVTNISYSSGFDDANNLTTVTIGTGIASTSHLPENVESFRLSSSSERFSVVDGVLLNKDETRMLLFPAKKSGVYTIPDSVTELPYSFENATNITTLVIGTGITSTSYLPRNVGSYQVGSDSPTFSSSGGVLFNKSGETLVLFPAKNSGGFSIPGSTGTIGRSAFDSCSLLTSVTIPDSVTNIEYYAFENCKGLTSVSIGSGVKAIGSSAFYGCEKLTSVKISDLASWCGIEFSGYSSNPLYYAKRLYLNGQEIRTLSIPSSVTKLSSYVFYGWTNLTSATIPNSVTNIGYDAFYNCKGLASVSIGSGVKTIGSSAFYGCEKLTSVKISDLASWCGIEFSGYSSNPLYYAKRLYLNGQEIRTLSIPSSVTKLSSYVFYGWTNLTSATIPNSVTNIKNYAFEDCKGLTSVSIGAGVKAIGHDAFYGCEKLTSVHIADLAAWCGIEFSGYSSNPLYYAKRLYLNGQEVKTLSIPSSVTKLPSYVFYGWTNLTAATIPNSVTNIGSSAFENCKGLTSISIGSGVKTIGSSAFYGCEKLTSVNVADLAAWCGIKFSGYSSNPLYYAKRLCLNGQEIRTLTIPFSVTKLPDYAFYGCSNIVSATIPNSVMTIGTSAFSGCSSLKSVNISSAVTTIPSSCFSGCSSLTSLSIPSSVTTIGTSAFSGCSSLKSVNIPSAVTTIPSSCFSGCSSLTSLSIPSSVTTIGTSAFSGCSSLKSVNIPSGVTEIPYGCFSGCSSLTSLSLPAGVMAIGTSAFSGCSSISSIDIPSSVTNIGERAFYRCSRLSSIVIPDGVTVLRDGTFAGCSGLTSISIPDNVTAVMESVSPYGYSVGLLSGCSSLGTVHSRQSFDLSGMTGSPCYHEQTVSVPYDGNSWQYGDEMSVIYTIRYLDGCDWCEVVSIGWDTSGIDGYNGRPGRGGAYWNDDPVEVCEIPSVLGGKTVGRLASELFDTDGRYGSSSAVPAESFVVPVGTTSIGARCFRGCSNLRSISIPETLTTIGVDAFYGCTYLSEVRITSLVAWTDILFQNAYDEGLDYGHSGSSSPTCYSNPLFSGLSSSGYSGYSSSRYPRSLWLNETRLSALDIPDGVTRILPFAFAGISVESLSIPDSVETIGPYAFAGMVLSGYYSNSGLVIGDGVTLLGEGAFAGISGNIRSIHCSPRVGLRLLENATVSSLPVQSEYSTMLSLRCNYCYFSGCDWCWIDSIENRNSAYSSYGYYQDEGLDYSSIVSLPAELGGKSVVAVFNAANGSSSYYSSNFGILKIPEGVIAVDSDLLSANGNGGLFLLPESLESIVQRSTGYNSYGYCRRTKLLVSEGAPVLTSSFDQRQFGEVFIYRKMEVDGETWLYEPLPGGATCRVWGRSQGSSEGIGIPAEIDGFQVTDIGPAAFFEDPASGAIALPDTVTKIGCFAFDSCTNVTAVTIPDGVSRIATAAFANCSGLASVVVPGSVFCIGYDAFAYCSGLESLVISNGVEQILDRAFYQCTGLCGEIVVPSSVRYVDRWSFYAQSDNSLWGTSSVSQIVVLFLPRRFRGYGLQFGRYTHAVYYDPRPTLAISSSYGSPVPGTGTRTCEDLEIVNASVEAPVPSDGIRRVCTGWTGTGSVPSFETRYRRWVETGLPEDFSPTNVSFRMLTHSSLEWNWRTDYRISVSVAGDGECSFGTQWISDGTTMTAEIVPSTHPYTISLSGDTDGVSLSGTTLTIPADRPRDILATVKTSVSMGEAEIPFSWLNENAADAVAAADGDYEAAARATAANGVDKVWQCYVSGVSPTNATERFEARIGFKDGEPVVSWSPDLNEDGTKHERVYTVEGKTDLNADSWGPTNESTRFFRVKVSMPE